MLRIDERLHERRERIDELLRRAGMRCRDAHAFAFHVAVRVDDGRLQPRAADVDGEYPFTVAFGVSSRLYFSFSQIVPLSFSVVTGLLFAL
jgi:hypothetical protein